MAVHNYTIVASPKNYWISPYALSISLNALGEPDRIQASTSSGAVIFCHFKNYAEIGDGSTFGFDVAHGFKSWPLTAAPTYFNSYSAKYLYVAIPRTANAGTYAMVVFPSDMIDIYGRKVYGSPMPRQDDENNYLDADGNIVSYDEAEMLYELVMDNDEPIQVGSESYYYIWLQGVITSSVNGTSPRDWQTIPHYETGQLDTAESWGEVITLEQLAREMKKKVDVDWFKRIFAIHGTNLHRMIVSGSDEDNPEYVTDEFGNVIYGGEDDSARDIQPNDMEHEITDVESKFGFWTERFLSALGTLGGEGGEGGGGGEIFLNEPLQGINDQQLGYPPYGGSGKIAIVWNYNTNQYEWGETDGGSDKIALYDYAVPLDYYLDANGVKNYDLAPYFLSMARGGSISGPVSINDSFLSIFHPDTFDVHTCEDHHVLTKGEIRTLGDNRYVRIDFFSKLFEPYTRLNGRDILVDINDVDVISGAVLIDNLKILVGTWTESYLSALGTQGSSSNSFSLGHLLNTLNNTQAVQGTPDEGEAIVWKNGGWTFDTAGGLDQAALASYLTSNNYITSNYLLSNNYITQTALESHLTTNNYLTQTAGDGRYITIDFFKRLFRPQNSNADIADADYNSTSATISSIKAMVGLWTESYISALGTQGSSSNPFSLGHLLNTLNNAQAVQGTPGEGQTIVWKNGGWTFDTAGGLDQAALASYLTTNNYITSSYLSTNNYITLTALESYLTTNKYLTETAADGRYITIDFFKRLFRPQNSNADIADADYNSTSATISSIKAMVGLWTESYISALGTQGGSSNPFSLGHLLNTLNNAQAVQGTPGEGQTIVWKNGGWTFGTAGGASTSDLDTYMAGKSWWGQTLSNGVVTGPMTGVTTIDGLLNFNTANSCIEIVGGNTAKAQLGYTPSTNIPYLRFGVPSGSVADVASLYQKTSNGTTLYHLILGQLGRQTYIVGDSVRLYAPASGGGFSPCLHTLTGGKVFIQGNGDSADYTNAQTYDYELYVSNSIFTKNLYLYRTNNAGTPIEAYLSGSRADSVNTISVNNANLSVPSGNISTQSADGAYVQIGAMRLVYDADASAIKVVKMNGSSETTTGSLYALGFLSALGTQGSSGGGGVTLGTVLNHINQHSPATFAPTSGFLYYNNGYWTGWTTNQLTSTLDSTFVTLSTQQTISGNKTFSGAVAISNTGSISSVNGFVHASISGDNTARNAFVLLAGGGYKSLGEIGGGGATLGSILDNINSHSPNSFDVSSNSLLYYNNSEGLWGTRAFSDFVTVSDAQTITGGKTFTAANTFSGTNTFNAAVTIGQDGSISSYNGFVKSNIVGASTNEQRDAYVLLAGGGHKALSEIGGGGGSIIDLTVSGTSKLTDKVGIGTDPDSATSNYYILKISGKTNLAGNLDIAGNIVPTTSNQYNLGSSGSSGKRFANLYVTNADVSGTLSVGTFSPASLTVSGTSKLTGKVGIGTDPDSATSNFYILKISGKTNFAGNVDIAGNIVPTTSNQYNLGSSGSSGKRFANLYVTNADVSGTLSVGTFSPASLTVSGTSKLASKVGIGTDPDTATSNFYILKISGKTNFAGNVDIAGNIVPTANNQYNLGNLGTSSSTVRRFANLYVVNADVSGLLNVAGTVTDSNYATNVGNSKLVVNGSAFVNGTIYRAAEGGLSDMRAKNVVRFIDNVSVDSIALAPIFDFTWKVNIDDFQHMGTSAQYWKDIFPNAVLGNGNEYLSMDYGATALASAVITARKVVDHERIIKELEAESKRQREEISELEKENERLRTEIEQLKAA